MSYSNGAFSVSNDGSIIFTAASAPAAGVLRAAQVVIAENEETIFSFTCDTRTTTTTPLPFFVALWTLPSLATGIIPPDLNAPVAGFKKTGQANPVTAIGVTATITESASSRLAFQIRSGLVRYFQDAGDYSTAVPLGTQAVKLSGSYVLFVISQTEFATDSARILSPILLRNQPTILYTAADQIADFGSTQSGVKTRAYQVSQVVGRSGYVEGTI